MRKVAWVSSLIVAMAIASSCNKEDKKKEDAPKTTEPAKDKQPDKQAAVDTSPEGILKMFDKCWGAFNAGDDATFKDCYGDSGEQVNVDAVPERNAKGGDAAVAMMKMYRTAFPDMKGTPQIVLVNGMQVASAYINEGTNKGEMMGMPATNKPIKMWGAQLATVGEDGKVVTDKHWSDQGTMMAQLGVMPNPMAPAVDDVKGLDAQVRVVAKDDDTEKANVAVIQSQVDALKKKDAKAILDTYADDASFTFSAEKKGYEGKAAIEKGMKEWMGMHESMELAPTNLWGAGDWVVSETTVKGKLGKDIPDLPVKTKGKEYESHYLELFQMADGKVKHHYIFANTAKWATDIGLMDPSKMGGAAAGGDAKKDEGAAKKDEGAKK